VRLVCVYAFRPPHSAAKLLHIPTEPVAS